MVVVQRGFEFAIIIAECNQVLIIPSTVIIIAIGIVEFYCIGIIQNPGRDEMAMIHVSYKITK